MFAFNLIFIADTGFYLQNEISENYGVFSTISEDEYTLKVESKKKPL